MLKRRRDIFRNVNELKRLENLTRLFNTISKECCIPEGLEICIIISLHKKGYKRLIITRAYLCQISKKIEINHNLIRYKSASGREQ